MKPIANSFIRIFNLHTDYKAKTTSELKDEIKELLKDKKLLIIIDDIDRLSTPEIQQIIRIVKINGDFPNSVYLLAFDREIIEKSLSIQEGINGHCYLEKIINLAYDLETPSPYLIKNYFLTELSHTVNDLPNENIEQFINEQNKWEEIKECLFNLLMTIRNIKRFINAVKFTLPKVYTDEVLEVNPIDFLGIEAIRLIFPDYYHFIYQNMSFFTTEQKLGNNNEKRFNDAKDFLNKSFEIIPDDNRDILKNLLILLFPPIKAVIGGVNSFRDFSPSEIWIANRNICSPSCFSVYFQHDPGIDPYAVTAWDKTRIKNISDDYELLYKTFQEYIKKEKISALLTLLESCVKEQNYITDKNITVFIQVLFDLVDQLSEETIIFTIAKTTQIFRIVRQLLLNKADKEKNYQVLSVVIQKTNSIYASVYYGNQEIEYLEKRNDVIATIPQNRLPELKELLCTLLTQKKNQVLDILPNRHFIDVCVYWKKLNGSGYQKYIDSVVSNPEQFLHLIDKMIYQILTKPKQKIFAYQTLAIFGDLDQFKDKIIEIKEKNRNLYIQYKESVDLFLENYDKRNEEKI